jgi:hypothetical protein
MEGGRKAEGERERAGGKGGGKGSEMDKGERCIISVLPLPQDTTGIFTSSTVIKRK